MKLSVCSGNAVAVAMLVLVGAAVRLYNLGTPSLWGDEMQVLFGMQMPLGTIWEWIARHEVHPPLFHLMMKAVSLADISDFALRLPWALCGIASIGMLYVLGKEAHSAQAGLFAAALLASNPLHIWLSRMVRPYALLILLCIAAFIFLLRALKSDARRDWAGLYLLNALMLLLHLNALMIVGSQGAVIFLACIYKNIPWRRLLQFCLFATLSFVPSGLVFVTATTRADMVAPYSYADIWRRSLYNLARAVDFYETRWLGWAVWGACVAGALRIMIRRRWEGLALGLLVVLPVAAVVLRRYGAYYNPWHVSYMLPAILVFAGVGLAWAIKSMALVRYASVAMSGILAASLIITLGDRLYGQDAVIISWYDPAHFKSLAKQFPEKGENTLIAVDDAFITGGTAWYLNQYRANNPLETMSLFEERAKSRLLLLGTRDDFNALLVSGNTLLGARPIHQTRIDTQNIWTLEYERLPARRIDRLPYSIAFDMNPVEVLGRARSLSDLTVQYAQGWKLRPTRHEAPGIVEFEFENAAGKLPHQINLALPFRNAGVGNTLRMLVSFDEEPGTVVAASQGPDIRGLMVGTLSRNAPYEKLRVRLEAVCTRNTPEYLTGALESVTLHGLRLAVCPLAEEGPCSVAAKNWLEEMLWSMHLGSKFTDSHPPQQHLVWSDEDFTLEQSSEYPLWSILRPRDPSRESIVKVTLGKASGDLVFYPRVGGGSSVLVRTLATGGQSRDVLYVPGLEGIWSPIAANYPLTVNKGAEIEIVLKGKWAQLWIRNKAALFERP